MQNNLNTLLTGSLGAGLVEVTQAAIPAPDEIQSIGQLLIQLIIGIVTIWQMIKKPKPKK